ncbi:MAG: spermidine/putrescine ABC transporter substrate-binding protein [Firmicutes bacterium]|nr:spermidine/putrescine ABC transporter substrate-binding protein [Bacillota bacterium]
MKKVLAVLVSLIVLTTSFSSVCFAAPEGDSAYDMEYYSKFQGQGVEINVYNWGEYIADGEDGLMDINAEFTELTGIKVNYLNYETNEAMYAKIKSGANNYDVIFPSDYMVSRLIQEGLVQEINFDNVPNFKYIDKSFVNPIYDPEQKYSVPYAWNRVAIIYNKEKVGYEIDSWDVLWDSAFDGQILMFKNSRDAFGVAQMALGFDINTEDIGELDEAAALLKAQKPLVQAYVMDQVFDKMQNNEAAIATYYVGDYYIMKEVNEDLGLYIPDATNLFVDAVCIPSNAQNKEAAEMYINFLNEPQVAADNMEYILYSTPNTAARELLPDEMKNNPDLYPSAEDLANDVAYINLSNSANLYMDSLWTEILADEEGYNSWFMPAFFIVAIVAIVASMVLRKRKKSRDR